MVGRAENKLDVQLVGRIEALEDDCQFVKDTKIPTRRSKINYLLAENGIDSEEMEEFVAADLDSFMELFKVFNSATHGPAGKHSFAVLGAIKSRTEGGIMFLASLAGGEQH